MYKCMGYSTNNKKQAYCKVLDLLMLQRRLMRDDGLARQRQTHTEQALDCSRVQILLLVRHQYLFVPVLTNSVALSVCSSALEVALDHTLHTKGHCTAAPLLIPSLHLPLHTSNWLLTNLSTNKTYNSKSPTRLLVGQMVQRNSILISRIQ